MKKLIEVSQVARQLGVSSSNVYRMIKTRKIQCVSLGTRKSYRVPAIEIARLTDGESFLDTLAEEEQE